LGTTVTNQNCDHEEMEGRLHSGNACHHSVQNLSFYPLFCVGVKLVSHEGENID